MGFILCLKKLSCYSTRFYFICRVAILDSQSRYLRRNNFCRVYQELGQGADAATCGVLYKKVFLKIRKKKPAQTFRVTASEGDFDSFHKEKVPLLFIYFPPTHKKMVPQEKLCLHQSYLQHLQQSRTLQTCKISKFLLLLLFLAIQHQQLL